MIALTLVGAAAIPLAGFGVATLFRVSFLVGCAMSIALHFAWISGACTHRLPLLVALCWPACARFAFAGMAHMPARTAHHIGIFVEIVLWLLARSFMAEEPWPDRLARFRRWCDEIGAQVNLLRGMLSGRQGNAKRERLLAELADLEAASRRARTGARHEHEA